MALNIAFKSGALPSDPVELHGFVGKEELSRLYEYELTLVRRTAYTDDEIDKLLKDPCVIAMGNKKGDLVHGILSSIQLVGHNARVTTYRATMVPSVWLMTQSRTNRLFQNMKVHEMVQTLLARYGLGGTDFEIQTWGASPTREYVVQYEESDWDFVQRWLEHEGYFYWFEHGDQGEKLVISHDNGGCPPISGSASIPYRETNNLLGAQSVVDWQPRYRRIPARVALVDYNYRRPASRVVSKADVDTKRGFGSVVFYGDHLKDKNEGDDIAKVRAERIACERVTIEAGTDCSRFRVGHTFELENHSIASFDGDYLITKIEHRGGQGKDSAGQPMPYRATFEAIPLKVPYRPERTTEWPSIHGVLHAHVDSDSSGDYAQLDDQGRYKVHLPFDGSDATGSGSSRWVRMAQHYSGAGYGSHFPLHKGAEVILAHIDGDPDRPIIVASVPNPSTLTPSTSSNATQSVIQTASGIRMEMEDLQG